MHPNIKMHFAFPQKRRGECSSVSKYRGCSISCLHPDVGCGSCGSGLPAGDLEINTEWNNRITTSWICFEPEGFLREMNFDA